MELAQSNVVTYILRYKPPASGAHAHGSLHLSGYGAELALKSTEYKVTDDRNADKGRHLDAAFENTWLMEPLCQCRGLFF